MSAFCRFIDSFGFEWQAYEVAVPRPAPHSDRRVLYFFSRGSTRALEDFPRQWENLSWAELEDLCAQGRAIHSDGLVEMHPGLHARARRLADAHDGAGAVR